MTAVVVVPRIKKCGGGDKAIMATVVVGVSSGSFDAGLFVGCEKGKARYFPGTPSPRRAAAQVPIACRPAR